MGAITDRELTDHATHERAIRQLAADARGKMHERAVSVRVAVVRSPAGEWRVATGVAELVDVGIAVEISVFRGETAESGSLLGRVTWATTEVLRKIAER